MNPVVIGNNSLQAVAAQLAAEVYSSLFVLCDTNTRQHCYPLLQSHLPDHHVFTVPAGEEHKTLTACEGLWHQLIQHGADRHSILINLGGGMVSDLGGFTASCYMRGIRFINIPTSLLAMADASVGAKTGVNFSGIKNVIGSFYEPLLVAVWPGFLATLPPREVAAGFAEVLKHYLIADADALEPFRQTPPLTNLNWTALLQKNVAIKSAIVQQDPTEQNQRKALNFGHTIGHALESYFLQTPNPLLHGEAVAAGMVGEAFLSTQKQLLSENGLHFVTRLITAYFQLPVIPEKDFSILLRYMQHDKKNQNGQYRFTLLNGIGNYSINCSVEEGDILSCLRYYNQQLA